MSSINDRKLHPGETLCLQGDEASSAYLVKEGVLEISTDRDGLRQVVARVGVGDLIGEMAILDGSRRSANVIAVTEVILFEFTREQFERRLGLSDPIVKLVLGMVLKRMRRMLGTEEIASTDQSGIRLEPEEFGPGALALMALERDLEDALRNNGLTLFYQPIIELATGRFAGVEALVRWHHPTRGFMMPGQFIPLAEATGLITDLTRWAIREACARMPDFAIAALKGYPATHPIFVSVNVSAGDLIVDGFADEVIDLVKTSGIEPERLKLEITESTLMANLEGSSVILRRFRDLGIGISIDDFGTGYSSLASLSRLPTTCLKIDRAFVTPLDTEPDSKRIVQAICQLAEIMQFDTVAEGIETVAQRMIVSDIGGKYGQGYLFGRPTTLAATLDLIRNWVPEDHIVDGGRSVGRAKFKTRETSKERVIV